MQLLITVLRSDMFDVNSKNKEIQNSNPLPRFSVITGIIRCSDTTYVSSVMMKRKFSLEVPIDNGSWLYFSMRHSLFSLFTTNSEEEDSIFHTLTIG